MKIRIAEIEDAMSIRKIYEPYVTKTAVSFEYEVPSIDEMKRRIKNTLSVYPYIVAIDDSENIVGYAYAGSFHAREAYLHDVELSVYVNESYRKEGVGSALYKKLMELLIRQNVYTVHACIASPDSEDEYLSDDSELFHKKMGFKLAGIHESCGYKFGRWYSIVWMDKVIKRPQCVEDFIPFELIRGTDL